MTRIELLTLGFSAEIKKLIKENHNDMELGKKIRAAFLINEERIKKTREENKN